MQGQDTQKSNVVSLFAARENAQPAVEAQTVVAGEAPADAVDEESFEDVMQRNAKNKERLEKERATANKSVLRTYRIKH